MSLPDGQAVRGLRPAKRVTQCNNLIVWGVAGVSTNVSWYKRDNRHGYTS